MPRRSRWTRERLLDELARVLPAPSPITPSALAATAEGRRVYRGVIHLYGSFAAGMRELGLAERVPAKRLRRASPRAPGRRWDREALGAALADYVRAHGAIYPGAMRRTHAALYEACRFHFGSLRAAAEAFAMPVAAAQRAWSREAVIAAVRQLQREGQPVNNAAVQRSQPALYGAGVRLFGNWGRALEAAGITPPARGGPRDGPRPEAAGAPLRRP